MYVLIFSNGSFNSVCNYLSTIYTEEPLVENSLANSNETSSTPDNTTEPTQLTTKISQETTSSPQPDNGNVTGLSNATTIPSTQFTTNYISSTSDSTEPAVRSFHYIY